MNAARFREGMAVGSGLAMAAFALAVSFGALSQTQDWGMVAPIVCSVIVFSGSAQFALLATLGAGGGVVTAVAAAALINSRFLPMGIAVAGDLRGGPVRRSLEGQTVVDGSWVAAHRGGGRFDRDLLLGATAVQWPGWIGGTVVGVVLAPDADLLHTLGLDVLTPAFFVALLLDEVRKERANRAAAVLGAVVAGVLVIFLPTGPALIGSASAALIALFVPRKQSGSGGGTPGGTGAVGTVEATAAGTRSAGTGSVEAGSAETEDAAR
ncbi:AzlC family ABC transporter permease [Streptomyces sp. NPDC058685]|uniref:AzlC family ABC transporter permease n=1 Tax=Streptomyces sp. NPDC058685 TaxID=3346598 RepID=UPI0036487F9D